MLRKEPVLAAGDHQRDPSRRSDLGVGPHQPGEVLGRIDRAGVEQEAFGEVVLPPDFVEAARIDRPPEDVVHSGVHGDDTLGRDGEVLHDVLARDLRDRDDGRGARRVARHQEPVAQPVDPPRCPRHHVPIESVTDPHGRAARAERDRVLGIEQHVDAFPLDRPRNGELVPLDHRAGRQRCLFDVGLVAVGAEQRGIAVQEHEAVGASEVEHRPQQLPGIHADPALVLIVVPQHDADPHAASAGIGAASVSTAWTAPCLRPSIIRASSRSRALR